MSKWNPHVPKTGDLTRQLIDSKPVAWTGGALEISAAGAILDWNPGARVDPTAAAPNTIRFGLFEADLASGELRKRGRKVPLQDQPFQVLAVLLRRRGEIVTREELQQALWPADTFVEFEQGLNTAVKRLRLALGDSADNPRFIETLPRKGYRFIAPMELDGAREQASPTLRLVAAAGIGESLIEPAAAVPLTRRIIQRWMLALGAVALVAVFMIGMGLLWQFRSAPAAPVVRSVIKLEPGYFLGRWPVPGRPNRTTMALSADGRFIVYRAVAENENRLVGGQLYLRRMDQPGAKAIPGTEGGISPFLSPDDRWVGFSSGGKLMKVPIDGGVPVTLCDAEGLLFGATWGSDNRIVFSSGPQAGLSAIPADGGKPEVVTVPDKRRQESGHRLPHFLPGGNALLFTVMREALDLQPRVAVLQLKTRQWRTLLEDAADARYVPTGHIIFLRQGTLMATRFDLDRLEVTGQPVPLIADVMQALNTGNTLGNTASGQFSVSGSGALLYALGGIKPDREDSLVWVDQKGAAQPALPFRGPFLSPRLSPDGRRIAYTLMGRERHAWEYDLLRGIANRLTGEGNAVWVAWTPDGKRVAFVWFKPGSERNLFGRPVDGSSPMERLTTSEHDQAPGSWSPDGNTLALVETDPARDGFLILLLDVRNHRITRFSNSQSNECFPEFSPDGRWLAYVSDESGQWEVYVRPFPGPGGKWQISREGGDAPLWARSGKQLFYRSADQVWEVDVQTGPAFSAGKPRLLFEQPGFDGARPIRDWDISLDGRRFLMVKLNEKKLAPVTEMILVQNWFEELKRLAPSGRK